MIEIGEENDSKKNGASLLVLAGVSSSKDVKERDGGSNAINTYLPINKVKFHTNPFPHFIFSNQKQHLYIKITLQLA